MKKIELFQFDKGPLVPEGFSVVQYPANIDFKEFSKLRIAVGNEPESYFDPYPEESAETTKEKLDGYVKTGLEIYLLYSVSNNTLAGFIMLHPNEEAKKLLVSILMVNPKFRKQGLGTFLITLAKERTREFGYHTCSLWAHSKSKKALGFYNELNFKKVDSVTYISLEVRV